MLLHAVLGHEITPYLLPIFFYPYLVKNGGKKIQEFKMGVKMGSLIGSLKWGV